jgi:hypothetical protein
MTTPSQQTTLASNLLASKHLVVVLGMGQTIPLFNTPDFMKGAGVSQAAGIQPFRGAEGLFSQSPHNIRSVLNLFDKDTFEVKKSSLLYLIC